MSELSENDIRRLDLTLLLIFLGLIRHRKAQTVADQIGLTQSAVSQSLKRLRDIFQDELFIRRPHGLEPTAVAMALEPSISQAVDNLRFALSKSRQFDPTSVTGNIRIAALDSEQSVILPLLMPYLARYAPGLDIVILPWGRQDALDALEEGRVDLALGYIQDHGPTIRQQHLYDQGFLVTASKTLLPEAQTLSLETYITLPHILVSQRGDRVGIVDDQLATLGLKRKVKTSMPGFLPAMALVAQGDAIATLPEKIVRMYAPVFELSYGPPPIEIRRFPVAVFWHRRDEADLRRIWLCQTLKDLVDQ